MNTTPLRRLSSSILLVIPVVIAMFCLVHVAEAADSTVVYAYPSGDTSGMSAQLAPGIGGCTLGCATLYAAAKTSLPARRQGLVAFAAPAGTTIVSAAISLRYRTLTQAFRCTSSLGSGVAGSTAVVCAPPMPIRVPTALVVAARLWQ